MRYMPIAALGQDAPLWSAGGQPSQWVTDAGAFVHGVFTGPSGLLAPVSAIIGGATGTQALTNIGAALHGPQTAMSYGQLHLATQPQAGPLTRLGQLGQQQAPDWLTQFDEAESGGNWWWWVAAGVAAALGIGGVVIATSTGR